MINRSVYEEDIIILDVPAANSRPLKHMKPN
jgi:hypothetical protein